MKKHALTLLLYLWLVALGLLVGAGATSLVRHVMEGAALPYWLRALVTACALYMTLFALVMTCYPPRGSREFPFTSRSQVKSFLRRPSWRWWFETWLIVQSVFLGCTVCLVATYVSDVYELPAIVRFTMKLVGCLILVPLALIMSRHPFYYMTFVPVPRKWREKGAI